MPEYKPRRLGDVTGVANTTPIHSNEPSTPQQDGAATDGTVAVLSLLSIDNCLTFAVAEGNDTPNANSLVFTPISVTQYYKLNRCQINVNTGGAGTFRGAFYEHRGGMLNKVAASEVSLNTATTGVVTATTSTFNLYPTKQYFWGFLCTTGNPTLYGTFSAIVGTPHSPLYYTTASSLPFVISLTACTKDYDHGRFVFGGIYYDSRVVTYL